MPVDERPNWDTYFEQIAVMVSTRASCPRASVGAVLVSRENRILATGYNGAPSGEPDCYEAGSCAMEDGHCQRAIHAEVNAVAYAAREGVSLKGARLYLYMSRDGLVCRECLKVLVAAGVQLARTEYAP